MSYPDNPHFAFPFVMKTRAAAVLEQDSPDEIVAAARAILNTPQGARLDNPGFGTREQLFRQGGASADEIRRALDQWEPRATYLVQVQPDLLDAMTSRVTVEVRSPTDA